MIGFMTGATVEYFSTAEVLALIFDRSPDAPLGGVQPESNVHPDPMKGELPKEALQLRQTSVQKRTQKKAQLRRVNLAAD